MEAVGNRCAEGHAVMLKIEGLEALSANVVRKEGHRLALRFPSALHPAVVDAFAQRFPSR